MHNGSLLLVGLLVHPATTPAWVAGRPLGGIGAPCGVSLRSGEPNPSALPSAYESVLEPKKASCPKPAISRENMARSFVDPKQKIRSM